MAETKGVAGTGRVTVDVGPKPPRKSAAWWYLTSEAKAMLRAARLEGRFGGDAVKAPYWMSQERGESLAEIEPQWYIRRAVARWKYGVGKMVNEYLRR